MFWMTVYFVCAYSLAGFALLLALHIVRLIARTTRSHNTSFRPHDVFRFVRLLLLTAPLAPYAFISTQTLAFGPSLRPAVQASLQDFSAASGSIVILRVLFISPQNATVYVFQSDGPVQDTHVAYTIDFVRTTAGWKCVNHEYLGEDGGSNGFKTNLFPPYPELE